MYSKKQEFLNFLLWSAELLIRPTFRNLTDSYESWAYRNGLLFQLPRLERQHMLERDPAFAGDRIYRLTAVGRLQVLGGRDPEERWGRRWDRQWRLVVFDVPASQNARREKLRRYLRARSFGCLQKSVWITPDSLEQERQILGRDKIRVQSLILLQVKPCGGETDADIVAGAWNFERINARYAWHIQILAQRPRTPLKTEAAARALRRWAAKEHQAWLHAVSNDPLLPACLLPKSYLGQDAWDGRVKALNEGARQLRTFIHPSS